MEKGKVTAITPFKVTDFGTNRKLICDFPLVINSNIISYLAPFSSYGSLLVKFSLAKVDRRILTRSLGVIPCEFPDDLYSPETRKIVLPVGENRMIVASFVSTKHRNVTEIQTDRQTAGRIAP